MTANLESLLRSGAGVDGLEKICKTCVFGELDWSPGVHEQFIGRLHRDGIEDHPTAYYLIADDGSDPVMCDILGIKKEQIEGIKNPTSAIVEKLQIDPEHIKKLAESFLQNSSIMK